MLYWHQTNALVKHLNGISGEEIVKLNIPTGMPLAYELDENLKTCQTLLPQWC